MPCGSQKDTGPRPACKIPKLVYNLVHCLVSGKTTIADGVCKPTYNRSDVNGCESWVVNLEDGQINCWKMFGR